MNWPSPTRSTAARALAVTSTLTVVRWERASGRKERLRGATGVITMHLSEGCTIGPPSESEYPVDPVGDDRMMPSAWQLVSSFPLR